MNEEYNIPAVLKQLRKTSGFSAKSVVKKLLAYGIDISDKTLYGYESGLSKLNADAFVALCDIYKCDNPLSVFKDTSPIDNYDFELLKKYHSIDSFGQETVNYILAREVKRVERTIISSTVHETPEQYGDNIIPMFTTHKKILHRTGAAGAGIGEIADNIETVKIDYPADKVPEGTDYTIDVTGDSMEPTYSDGDVLFCERGDNNLHFGDIGIFIIDGDTLVKEYGEDGLLSHNKKYDIIKINDGQSFKVEGKVLGKL